MMRGRFCHYRGSCRCRCWRCCCRGWWHRCRGYQAVGQVLSRLSSEHIEAVASSAMKTGMPEGLSNCAVNRSRSNSTRERCIITMGRICRTVLLRRQITYKCFRCRHDPTPNDECIDLYIISEQAFENNNAIAETIILLGNQSQRRH